MANKAFEIQNSTLRIGGVDLQAGTTGVVIPGVTQAANYKVDEVEDTDFNQTTTFTSAPTIIDAITFGDYLGSGTATGRATYTCELDGDGYIDDLQVVTEGSYTVGEADINGGSDMLAYTGAAGDPFSPFVDTDWTEIPFRPKMRADNVENIGLPTVTIPEELGTTYKGLQVSYGVVHSNGSQNELNVNKIVIHKPAATTTTIDPTSSQDDFEVNGLGGSDILALFVIYGDVNGPKPLSTLQAFAEAAIDFVILNSSIPGQYNTVDEMKTEFYNNYSTLAAAAGGLYAGFEFFNVDTNFTVANTTLVEGSGAEFTIVGTGTDYTIIPGPFGTNYKAGHKILIAGTDIGQSDSRWDLILTVNSVTLEGSIVSVTYELANPGFYATGSWSPVVGTNYQVGVGAAIFNLNYIMLSNTIEVSSYSSGSGYVVGDVLTILGTDITGAAGVLASPANDLTVTITQVNEFGQAMTFSIAGTIPRPAESWPVDNIGDGGEDQYDTANYISTNLALNIAYNDGNTVVDGTAAFGAGSTYSFVYDTAIFGMFATGSSATLIRTGGNSGADGNSITEAGNIYGPNIAATTYENAITHINILGGNQDGIRFSDGTVLTSAEGVGRVKLESPGGRRIEEVYGYKQVLLTQVTQNVLTTTTSRAGINEVAIWVDGTTTTIDDVLNDYNLAGIWDGNSVEFSLDNATWYKFSGGISSNGNERGYSLTLPLGPVNYNAGDTVWFRYNTGGQPVVWWDAADLPGSNDDFRGAIIQYHAYDNNAGTMIGTIHVANDSGDENVAHTESFSGGSNGGDMDLWYQDNENQLKYRRIDGNGATLKVQWTAKVFYGSEFWD